MDIGIGIGIDRNMYISLPTHASTTTCLPCALPVSLLPGQRIETLFRVMCRCLRKPENAITCTQRRGRVREPVLATIYRTFHLPGAG